MTDPGGRSRPLAPGALFDDVPRQLPAAPLPPATPGPPAWLGTVTAEGRWESVEFAAQPLGAAVRARIWSSPGLAISATAPLIVVHDGPEYDTRSALTHYLAVCATTAEVPALRAALLDPGDRDRWYSANPDYARVLAGAVLPVLRGRWPTSQVIGMGTSLGALAWLHAHRLYPDIADALFLQSGSFFLPDLDPQERGFPHFPAIIGFVLAVHAAGAPASRPVPTAMTCGATEENLGNNRRIALTLAAQGYPVTLAETPGGHDWTAWRDAFDPWLADLVRRATRG